MAMTRPGWCSSVVWVALAARRPTAESFLEALAKDSPFSPLGTVTFPETTVRDTRLPESTSVEALGSWASTDPASSPGMSRLRRSEEHTSELQSLLRISYAVFCLKKKTKQPK